MGSGTPSPEAYELFLKGRFLLQRDTEEDDREALTLFKQATERDPNFLDAHLAIVSTYARNVGSYASPHEAAIRADAALKIVARLGNPEWLGIIRHTVTEIEVARR